MWKTLWQKWTIDRPALLGDWLWDVFVVQFAALLNRLTLRRVIAIVPAIILVFAYAHDVPISPALMFVGDLLAYIDIFAVLFLLGVLSRVESVMLILKDATARIERLAHGLITKARRLDVRHRREHGSKARKRLTGRPRNDDDEPGIVGGFAWA